MPNSFCKSALSGLRFTVFFICWIQMSKHLQLYWSAVPSDAAFFSQNPPIIVLFRTWGKVWLGWVDLKSVGKKEYSLVSTVILQLSKLMIPRNFISVLAFFGPFRQPETGESIFGLYFSYGHQKIGLWATKKSAFQAEFWLQLSP